MRAQGSLGAWLPEEALASSSHPLPALAVMSQGSGAAPTRLSKSSELYFRAQRGPPPAVPARNSGLYCLRVISYRVLPRGCSVFLSSDAAECTGHHFLRVDGPVRRPWPPVTAPLYTLCTVPVPLCSPSTPNETSSDLELKHRVQEGLLFSNGVWGYRTHLHCR